MLNSNIEQIVLENFDNTNNSQFLIDTCTLYTRYFCNSNLHLSASLEKKSIKSDNIYKINCNPS